MAASRGSMSTCAAKPPIAALSTVHLDNNSLEVELSGVTKLSRESERCQVPSNSWFSAASDMHYG
eukprot:5350147-Amphidinium_carterae.1